MKDLLDNRKWAYYPAPPFQDLATALQMIPSCFPTSQWIIQLPWAAPTCRPILCFFKFCIQLAFLLSLLFPPTLEYSFRGLLFILQDRTQRFTVRRCRKVFLTLHQLPRVPRACLSGTALSVQSYIFTCIDSTTHKQKQTYFPCSMAPPREPSSSSGASLRKFRSVSMLRVCDHTACENCTDSLKFALESFRTLKKRGGGGAEGNSSCFKQDEIWCRISSPSHFWELETFTAEPSWSSRGQAADRRK